MMSNVEHARYYFIILILLSFAYPVARVWVNDNETPWKTPALVVLVLVTASLWAGIARWLLWKAGKPVVTRASILAGGALVYAISMMYLPLSGSQVLGGLSRLCVMAFLCLSAYVALFVSDRLFRLLVPARISAALSSAMVAGFAAFLFVLYALNIFFTSTLGTYLTYGLAVMSLNQVRVGAFILRTMGLLYQVTLLNILAGAALLFLGAYRVLANELAGGKSMDGRAVKLFVIAGMLLLAGLQSPYSTVITGSEPLVILAKSTYDSAFSSPLSSSEVRDIPRIKAGMNVLLIQADSLRAGSMGVYGYGRNTTPNIDRLAARGLVADRFYSASGSSEYNMAAIVNGVNPCLRVVAYPSIFEIMEDNGYRTGFFSSGDNKWANMDESLFSSGIDAYFDYESYSGGRGMSWNIVGGNMVDDAVTAGKAIGWMSGLNESDRFFLYFNPHSTHTTYGFNKSRDYLYTPYQDGNDVAGLIEAIRERRPSATNTYDNSVRYLDEEVGYVLDALDELNRSGDTVIILVSDHGEELMEHGHIGHGTSAYDEQLRVPFIMSYPGAVGTTHAGLGQHIDIVPTLMGVLGAETGPGYDGIDLLLRNRSSAYFCGPGDGIVRGDYKYFRSRVGGQEQLFNLADDPSESRNLAESRADVLDEMRAEYEAYAAS